MRAQKGNHRADRSIRVLGAVALLLAVAAFGACKRQAVAPATVARQPRSAGPSSQDMVRDARAKIMAGLDPIPALDAGTPFIAPNGEAWMRYDNGMMLHVLRPGDGLKPQLGQTVSVAYEGYFPENHKTFDKRASDNPLTFKLGSKDLLKGFNLAVSTMHPKEKTRAYLPVDLAYGPEGRPVAGIGRDQPLVFEIELLSVSGPSVGFTLEDLPKFEPLGPKLPASSGTEPAGKP